MSTYEEILMPEGVVAAEAWGFTPGGGLFGTAITHLGTSPQNSDFYGWIRTAAGQFLPEICVPSQSIRQKNSLRLSGATPA